MKRRQIKRCWGGIKNPKKMEYVHSPEFFPSFQPNDWLTDVGVTKQKETRDILSKWDLYFIFIFYFLSL